VTAQISVVAGVAVALYAAHPVADYWVQTSHQALLKGEPGPVGRWNCAKHVATYTVTCLVVLDVLFLATGWQPHLWALLAGLGFNAVTHYAADRRTPLRRLARLVGREEFWEVGTDADKPCLGTGALALDQAFHQACLFVAALIIAI
jgi:hypothetical protein